MKSSGAFWTAAVLVIVPILAEAATVDQPPKGTPMKKMGRGVMNVVTGVLEIPREMSLHTQAGMQQGQYPFTAMPEGIVKGLFTGTVKALGRIGSGVYDIITFPIETPANYGSLYQPPTIFAPGNWTALKKVRVPE